MVWLAGCSGQQSALDPAGREAEQIARLFWWMTICRRLLSGWQSRTLLLGDTRFGGSRTMRVESECSSSAEARSCRPWSSRGCWFTASAMMPPLLARAPEGSLRIAVTGEQWWWRVRYLTSDGGEVVLANEIRLPVGEPVEFHLESPDVIHSFWIPSLGGKMDMIPGRRTRLALQPTRTGIFRGACAEYCGTSHALMAFSSWSWKKPTSSLAGAAEAAGGQNRAEPLAAQGRDAFWPTAAAPATRCAARRPTASSAPT